jgi:hypothetical protein
VHWRPYSMTAPKSQKSLSQSSAVEAVSARQQIASRWGLLKTSH